MPPKDVASHASDIFKATAGYYSRFRPGYPDALIDHIVNRFVLGASSRILDLGCGTGQLTIPLAAHVGEVFGIDPEPEMLVEAERQAASAGVGSITWILGSSDDLDALAPRLEPLQIATMMRSFHWMNADATLQPLDGIISPDGGIVIGGDGCGLWNGFRPWEHAVRKTVQRWLGERRRAGSGTYPTREERWEPVIARSPFTRAEPWQLKFQRTWDIDAIVGYVYSTSFASPAVLGERRAGFEADLRATLHDIEPSGQFLEDVELEAVLVWRDR